MKINLKNCVICDQKIETTIKRIGNRGKEHGKTMTYVDSDEGVYFHGKWICNSCWDKITKYKKIKKILKK